MSTIQSAQAPSSSDTHARPRPRRLRPPVAEVGSVRAVSSPWPWSLGSLPSGCVPAMSWIDYRRTHSITDDAFVEAHIVNVAPQMVSGRIVRFLADENDRVGQGQVVAEIDPIPYRDKVNISRAQLDSAQAELARQRADLDRVRKEVPIQIEIARRTFAAAEADRARAEESLKLTRDEVEKGDRRGPRRGQGGAGLADAGRAGVHTLHPARAAGGQHAAAAAAGDAVARLGRCAGGPRRGQAGQGPGLPDPDRRRPADAGGRARSRNRRRPRALTSPRPATTRSARSSCWSRSRSNPSSRPGGRWRPPRTTWRIPRSEPRSPAWWSSGTATWATSSRRALRCLACTTRTCSTSRPTWRRTACPASSRATRSVSSSTPSPSRSGAGSSGSTSRPGPSSR